jgi:hypothetical protein
MNKIRAYLTASELVLMVIIHFSIGKAAMHALRLWKFRNECIAGIAKGAKVFCKQQNAGFSL